MSVLDKYDQWVSDAVVSTVGPSPLLGVIAYGAIPVLVGRAFGFKRAGVVISLGLMARLWLREQQGASPTEQFP